MIPLSSPSVVYVTVAPGINLEKTNLIVAEINEYIFGKSHFGCNDCMGLLQYIRRSVDNMVEVLEKYGYDDDVDPKWKCENVYPELIAEVSHYVNLCVDVIMWHLKKHAYPRRATGNKHRTYYLVASDCMAHELKKFHPMFGFDSLVQMFDDIHDRAYKYDQMLKFSGKEYDKKKAYEYIIHEMDN